MKTFFKIFAIILLAQFAGHLSLATCDCGGLTPAKTNSAYAVCKDCIEVGCYWDNKKICDETGSTGANSVNLINPLGGTEKTPQGTITSVPVLIHNIINAALGVVGSLALVMFIYGGFTWMLAAGNEQSVEKGRNIIIWAALGLVVIFASYSLVNFVISAITTGSAAPSG